MTRNRFATPSTSTPGDRPPPFAAGLTEELTVWLAASLFLPWVLLERGRRHWGRLRGRGKDHAVGQVLRRLRWEVRHC